MCARYELNVAPQDIIERFGLCTEVSVFNAFYPTNDIRPTNRVPVIGQDDHVKMLRWGLEVPWQSSPIINARSETAAQKPTFKALLNQRVIVPATAYFEWRKDGADRIKTRIALANAAVFAMAGFCDGDRFTVLTCGAAPEISYIHNRMPVVFAQSAEMAWLNPDAGFDVLASCLTTSDQALTVTEPSPAPHKQGTLSL